MPKNKTDIILDTFLDGFKAPEPSADLNDKIMAQTSTRITKNTPVIFTIMRRAVPLFGIALVVMSLYSFFYGPQASEREIAAFLNETIALEIYEAEIAHALVSIESDQEMELFLLESDLL